MEYSSEQRIQDARDFIELIRNEILEAEKARLTGNTNWSGEFIKAPIKAFYPGVHYLEEDKNDDKRN